MLYPYHLHELTLQIVVSYNKLTIFWSWLLFLLAACLP